MIKLRHDWKGFVGRVRGGFMKLKTGKDANFNRVVNDPALLLEKLNNPDLKFYAEKIKVSRICDMSMDGMKEPMEISLGENNQIQIKKTPIIVKVEKPKKDIKKKPKKKARKKGVKKL